MGYVADKYTQYFIVQSGQAVSEHFHIGEARLMSLHIPSIESSSMYINGSAIQSGTFQRIYNGNNEQVFAVGSGERVVGLGNIFAGIPHMKLELTTAQTDVRTFALTVLPK